jgi:hypothetical protein
MRHMTKLESAALVVIVSIASALLGACSGGGGGGGGGASPQTAPLTLSVTDTPVDPTQIAAVCVSFNRITLHYDNGQQVTLDYAPAPSLVTPQTHCLSTGAWDGSPPVPPVRLDALGGALSVALADNAQVPVGRITWIRLHFTGDSYVVDTTGGQHDLRCPSCEPTDNNAGRGFKLIQPFELTGAGLNLVVDVDLRKSLHIDSNGYVLRPTAKMRVGEAASLGTIAGQVDALLVRSQGGSLYTGTTVETGCSVYAYAAHDTVPDDIYDGSPVVATAPVRYDVSLGQYRYAIGALPGGTAALPTPYTVALTCGIDDPTINDSDVFVPFYGAQNADVLAGETTIVDFLAPTNVPK